jgi:hypothetical protein
LKISGSTALEIRKKKKKTISALGSRHKKTELSKIHRALSIHVVLMIYNPIFILISSLNQV